MKKRYPCSGQFNGKPCNGDHAPHSRGMCALAGINELRRLVNWADSERESSHENQTAEEILARFRMERDS